jgi:CBS domain containing-hemolysin-like protein
MLLFVIAVAVVLVVAFLCSIFESVLQSLTRPEVEVIVSEDRRAGSLLAGFKENMDVPIAAILILNTAAHTIGAAVAVSMSCAVTRILFPDFLALPSRMWATLSFSAASLISRPCL